MVLEGLLLKKMTKKIKMKSYEDAVTWLRGHEFDLLEAPGTSNRVFLKKYNCSAAIERAEDGGIKVFAYPGYLMNGEISKLVDHGYQKVLKTTKAEFPATADHLKALAPVHRGIEGSDRRYQSLQRRPGHGKRVLYV